MLNIDTSDRTEQRNFGMVMAVALTLLAVLRWWHGGELPGYILLAVMTCLAAGMAVPTILSKTAAMWLRYSVTAVALGAALLLRVSYSDGFPLRLLIVAAAFLTAGAIAPAALKPILIVWLKVAIGLNWVMTRLLLSIVFFGMIVPFRICIRIFGKDPMKRARLPDAPTYWENPDEQPADIDRYFEQY